MPLTSDCYEIQLQHLHLPRFVILRFSRICSLKLSRKLSRICPIISQLQIKSIKKVIKNYVLWNIKCALLLPSHQNFKFSTKLIFSTMKIFNFCVMFSILYVVVLTTKPRRSAKRTVRGLKTSKQNGEYDGLSADTVALIKELRKMMNNCHGRKFC